MLGVFCADRCDICHRIHRYVYQLRDLVRLYGTEEESANSLSELERTEDWLYNEGSATDNPGACTFSATKFDFRHSSIRALNAFVVSC
eukprot:COSAG02_NODE_6652_length_3435_cov_2.810252_5_plen_88_part_00